MIAVTLRADPQDGNDPIDADVTLPVVPRLGDEIEVWISREVDRGDGTKYRTGDSYFLEVEAVRLCAYAPDAVEVWVKYSGYDRAELGRIMLAAKNGERP